MGNETKTPSWWKVKSIWTEHYEENQIHLSLYEVCCVNEVQFRKEKQPVILAPSQFSPLPHYSPGYSMELSACHELFPWLARCIVAMHQSLYLSFLFIASDDCFSVRRQGGCAVILFCILCSFIIPQVIYFLSLLNFSMREPFRFLFHTVRYERLLQRGWKMRKDAIEGRSTCDTNGSIER